MAEDWSRQEVEATVEDYFTMLHAHLRGEPYNKTHHRRRLALLLHGRSDGAIERKHQNISAVLIELGFPYIPGYKPLRNYQQLLFDIVATRLVPDHPLVGVVAAQVREPAAVPTVDDILASLVDPPVPDRATRQYGGGVLRERPAIRRDVDYLELEARNRSLGTAGEEFVIRFEVARLLHAGSDRLASRVEHVSATRGDGSGFDVRRQPRLFYKPGNLERTFHLDPVQYMATVL